MPHWLELFITVLCAFLASSGFWAYISSITRKKSAETRMILGLGYDRIMYLGMSYIERGYITREEYEDLLKYLYKPYKDLGGNGSAERIMREVEALPIRQASKIGTSK